MSLLVLCKILRLFVNILTVDDKYSLLNRGNLRQPIKIIVSQKQKFFSQFFSEYLKSTLNCKHFQKKWWSSKPIYFWNYGLRKRWLDKCLKSPVFEDLSRSNMLNGPKHYCILDGTTFTIFIDHCEGNWVGKSFL